SVCGLNQVVDTRALAEGVGAGRKDRAANGGVEPVFWRRGTGAGRNAFRDGCGWGFFFSGEGWGIQYRRGRDANRAVGGVPLGFLPASHGDTRGEEQDHERGAHQEGRGTGNGHAVRPFSAAGDRAGTGAAPGIGGSGPASTPAATFPLS